MLFEMYQYDIKICHYNMAVFAVCCALCHNSVCGVKTNEEFYT